MFVTETDPLNKDHQSCEQRPILHPPIGGLYSFESSFKIFVLMQRQLLRKFVTSAGLLQAGIIRKNLSIALESEAASVWCQTIPLDKNQATVSEKGTKYMTCDLGGRHVYDKMNIWTSDKDYVKKLKKTYERNGFSYIFMVITS